MGEFIIAGGTPLHGKFRVGGAKNAVLPLMAACMLTNEPVTLVDVPHLSDVLNMREILKCLGCHVSHEGHVMQVDASVADSWHMPDMLAHRLRSSIFLLGPIIARFRQAVVTYPGGCEIGLRPIDMHLNGLRALGVHIEEENGQIICHADVLRGADIYLDYPSVGATENIMMAAVLAQGVTRIHNAAQEPEIGNLQALLVKMGARIASNDGNMIEIEGVGKLHGVEHHVMSDRIVAGTWMCAAAITGGDIELENVSCEHLQAVIGKLKEAGCQITRGSGTMRIVGLKRPSAIYTVETNPYPGFPTDMQAQILALAAVADGTSVIVENIFENRFKHVTELAKMGAKILVRGRTAVVHGKSDLSGAHVQAHDLRGGAALALAALRAHGQTVVEGIEHIDRGYEDFEGALRALGAEIVRT